MSMNLPHTRTLEDILANAQAGMQAKTCLVVDDSSVVRQVAAHMFEELGYTVQQASNGLDAVNICQASAPTLVLLDWNMPIMDGLDCLMTLRRSALRQIPRIMLCTSESAFEKIKVAIAAGADEYIIKPFNKDVLLDKLVHLGLETAS